MDKSEGRAREIIARHVGKLDGGDILSLILVGSLSNGSYTGNAGSDIDLIHVLCDGARDGARERTLALIAQTEAETARDIPISRCVYYFSDLTKPFAALERAQTKDYLELPVELLRVKESGVTLFGADIISRIRAPGREDVLASFEASRRATEDLRRADAQFDAEYTATVQNPGTRMLAQIVLTRAMKDLFREANVSCSSKREIARAVRLHMPDYAFHELLDLCVKWRHDNANFTERDDARAHELYRLRLAREAE